MKRNLLVLAAVMAFAFLALGAVGHTSAQGPTGTPPPTSSVVALSVDTEPQSAVDTDTTQDQSGAQVEDGTPDGTELKSNAPDTDTIQDGSQSGNQIEDGLPETTTPETGG